MEPVRQLTLVECKKPHSDVHARGHVGTWRMNIIKENKVLLIDEIDTSLHNKLVEYIIRLFHQSDSAQLIYTTHNTYLLDTDKLRKDQVYFVNKRQDGSSELYSLFDFKDFRENMDLEKAYMQGRFDAIPLWDLL